MYFYIVNAQLTFATLLLKTEISAQFPSLYIYDGCSYLYGIKWTHLIWHYLQKCTSENNFIFDLRIIISAFQNSIWGYFCCYIKLKYILRYGKFTRLQKFSLLKIEEMSEISAQCITGIYVTYVTITMATAAILDSWKYKKMYM